MTIDVNTILIGILLALSSWTLYTVHGLAVTTATEIEKNKGQDASLAEDRARIIDAETSIGVLEKDVAVLKSQRH